MERWLAAAGILAITISSMPAHPQKPITPPGSVCWPLHFAGITLGATTDSEVKRLLGEGVFRKNEGDTGGRYFVDLKGAATLHVVSFTDSVVGELTLSTGMSSSISRDEQKSAISKWFNPIEGFGNWGALRLGSSREEVLKNLGKPKEKIASDQWRYDTQCACEIPEYFTIFFKEDHIFKVVFSAPAG